MESNLSNERRQGERRQGNGILPAGMQERRINIERRLFDLDAVCLDEWLRNPAPPAQFGASKPN